MSPARVSPVSVAAVPVSVVPVLQVPEPAAAPDLEVDQNAPPGGARRRYHPRRALDLRASLALLSRGRGDPTTTSDAAGLWRAATTPEGPGTLLLRRHGPAVSATAWGPGATWLLAGLPALLGEDDPLEDFVPGHPLLTATARHHPGLRVGACGLVFEMLVAAVLEQRVTGREARRAWRTLVLAYGTPAPGPAPVGLTCAPTAGVWRRIPSWDWHRAGVDHARSRTILGATYAASALERTVGQPVATVETILRSLPGVGVWTAAEVMLRAHGNADAVSYGDFHLSSVVGYALLGRPLDDDGMRVLLEPWAGHRGRVVRLAELSGRGRPKFGPRYAGADYRRM